MIYKLLGLICLCFSQSKINEKGRLTNKVQELLRTMTVKEKVGQLTQINMAGLYDKDTNILDEGKLDYYVNQYNVGSFLNTLFDKGESPPASPELWIQTMNKIQSKYKKTRLKIPMIYGLDCIHGANYIYGATLFPQQLGLASSFNNTISKLVGSITAKDTRSVGVHWNFSPVLDIAVNKQWGRVFETFGEDPYLAGELGKEIIYGYQGYPKRDLRNKAKVAATMKHFIGYSATNSGKDVDGSWLADRLVYDYFQRPYDAAIEADVATVMESYSDIAGDHLINSKKFLVKLLRQKMNFTGVLVTDWGQIEKLHEPIHIAKSPKDAVRLTMRLGTVDISMVPNNAKFCDYLTELINEGVIPIQTINKNVERVLNLKQELGLLDSDGIIRDDSLSKTIGSKQDNDISLQAAREGVILLKNNNLLPLKKDSKVFVTGPTSNSLRYQNGGWTHKWPGPSNDNWFDKGSTILQGIRKHSKNVYFDESIDIKGSIINNSKNITQSVKDINPDYIVVCLGEENYVEFLGNINDMRLPRGQTELIDQLKTTGKPIILMLSQGRPRVVDNVDKVDAIINGFLLGPHAGEAFGDVLFGEVNPSGKLPITYSNHPNDNTISYYVRANENYDVQWPFGFGLSYTEFEYSDLLFDKSVITENEILKVSVKVTNVGKYPGKETALLFITDQFRSIAPEKKKLKRFKKFNLMKNQSQIISFDISLKDLDFYDEDNKKRVEAGDFTISINNLKKDFSLVLNNNQDYILLD